MKNTISILFIALIAATSMQVSAQTANPKPAVEDNRQNKTSESDCNNTKQSAVTNKLGAGYDDFWA